MAQTTDFYEVLGVPRTASKKEIRSSYQRLARKHHPDLNPGDQEAEEQFKRISQAYEVLGDDEKRKQYDAGAMAYGGGGPGGPGGGGTWRPSSGQQGAQWQFDVGDLGDLFGGIFGGTARRAGPRRGEDLQFELQITLEEAFRGGERRLTISAPDHCPTCHGSGAEPGATQQTCPQCKGSGRGRQIGGFGFDQDEACARCQGTGRISTQPCHTCRGAGTVERPRAVTVTIPRGIAEGQKLRVAGQGNPGESGAPAGDLYLIVQVKRHPLFERKGADLYLDLPVTFAEAALGAEVQVPTLSGKVNLTVPPGVQSGQQLRLKERGMPRRGGGSGDLYVRIKVTVPKNLGDEERQLIARLRELRSENPRERLLSS